MHFFVFVLIFLVWRRFMTLLRWPRKSGIFRWIDADVSWWANCSGKTTHHAPKTYIKLLHSSMLYCYIVVEWNDGKNKKKEAIRAFWKFVSTFWHQHFTLFSSPTNFYISRKCQSGAHMPCPWPGPNTFTLTYMDRSATSGSLGRMSVDGWGDGVGLFFMTHSKLVFCTLIKYHFIKG